jgi:hypothetical protein
MTLITIVQVYANHLPRWRAGRQIERLRAEFDLAPRTMSIECPRCGLFNKQRGRIA